MKLGINYFDGYQYTAKIDGTSCVGEIAIEDGTVYLLQNFKDGSIADNLRGYKYSWTIEKGTGESLLSNAVTEFRIEGILNVGDKVQVKSHITSFAHGGRRDLNHSVGVISKINSKKTCEVKFDIGETYYMSFYELEPRAKEIELEPTKPEPSPLYDEILDNFSYSTLTTDSKDTDMEFKSENKLIL